MTENDYPSQLTKLKNIPPLPEVSLRILNAVNDPEITIDDFADVLNQSPSLVARLLGLANSAYFGRSKEIKDLRTAIIQVLGVNLVKNLAMSIALNGHLNTRQCKKFQSDYYWGRSLTTAILAQKIAFLARRDELPAITIYTGGLLSNIGILVSVYLFPAEMDSIFDYCAKNQSAVSAQMFDVFTMDQYQIGYILLNKWHLPQDYQSIVKGFSKNAQNEKDDLMLEVLKLCHRISGRMLAGDENVDADVQALAEVLSLSNDKIQQIIQEIKESISEIEEVAKIISG